MSSYNQPIRDYAIFDSLAFQQEETEELTLRNANSNLLKYPDAQDNENFQQVNITAGIIDMKNNNITNMDNISSNLTDKTSNLVVQERIYQEIEPIANNSKENGFLSFSKMDVPSLTGKNYQLNNWNSRTTALDQQWNSLAYSPELNRLVSVASFGTGNRVQYSNNGGITWISTPSSNNISNWNGVAWSSKLSRFVAVANSNSRFMYSSNGISWTNGSGTTNGMRAVIWVEELSLFVATAISGNAGQRISTSADGINWTTQTTPTPDGDQQWLGITWSPDKRLLVAVANTGSQRVMVSKNAINWSLVTVPTSVDWQFVTYSRELERFVAVGEGTTNCAMYSDDGYNWTLSNTTTGSFRGVCWSNDLNLFIACDAQTTSSQRIIASADGVTWTRKNTPSNISLAVTYIKEWGRFVVICSSGVGNRCFTSPLVDQVPTSLNVFESQYNNVNENNQWEMEVNEMIFNNYFVVNGNSALISDFAGGNSGDHLVVRINGTPYKIRLLNPN